MAGNEASACQDTCHGYPRRHGTMYGMLLESVQYFVRTSYSEQSWKQVLQLADMAHTEFATHKQYSDETMVNVAKACCVVIGERSTDEWLAYFGRCFVKYFTHYGYDLLLRISGRHYRDFLHGIDNIHEMMRFSYPRMVSPSFYVSHEDGSGCLLHYRSKRVGFKHYVLGQLQQCAKQFYNVSLGVSIVREEEEIQGRHVVYRLDFDNTPFLLSRERTKNPDCNPFPFISAKTFFKVFPFTFVFDQSLTIILAGQTVQNLFPPNKLIGQNILRCFRLRRPQMEFTWENVICLQKVVFELETVEPIYYRGRHGSRDRDADSTAVATKHLLLRGQMKYAPDFNGVVFMCTPLLNDLEEMQALGLYINDLNMFDTSRDMVLAGWQHASRLEYSIEKQREHSERIRQNMIELDSWKQRSEALLYSMMPRHIANRLKNGEDPINTCEILEHVTILFSYLLGFNELISRVAPLQLVECINSVFVVFDATVDKYEVFKVETLGDAVYMVAGGVLEKRTHQTDSVAAVALEFIEKVKCIQIPDAMESLQLRAGMHTGSVVAGVVGKRMPQYCLFGDTVNTASRMQTYSEPGCIHISEPCQKYLRGTEYVTMSRGKVNIKGKGEMKTYWLLGRRSDPDIATRINLFRTRHAVGLRLQQRRFSDMNLHLTHQSSEVCLFELVPPSPDDVLTRGRSFSNDGRSRGTKSRDYSEPVSKAGSSLRLHLKESVTRLHRSRSFSEFTDSELPADSPQSVERSPCREFDIATNINFGEIDRIIEGHRKQLAESQKQIVNADSMNQNTASENANPIQWIPTGSSSESADTSDSEDACCPFLCNCGTRTTHAQPSRKRVGVVTYVPANKSSLLDKEDQFDPGSNRLIRNESDSSLDQAYYDTLLYGRRGQPYVPSDPEISDPGPEPDKCLASDNIHVALDAVREIHQDTAHSEHIMPSTSAKQRPSLLDENEDDQDTRLLLPDLNCEHKDRKGNS